MRDHADPVDAVILAFLDHLDGTAPRPTLDHLAADDRRRAEAYLSGLLAARGIDPQASRPSIESLLVDTPLAGLLPALSPVDGDRAELRSAQRVLEGVDSRALVEIDRGGSFGATLRLSYLDLRARFVLVPAEAPVVTETVRTLVEALFDADPDTSRVGVVAGRSEELTTQVLSAEDVGDTITTPHGAPHRRWPPPLPLALAARRMLEQSAPEWPAFDFDQAHSEALDLTSVAAEIARRVIERESARSYRGDKRRAYRALLGQEHAFADLVTRISVRGTGVDLEVETTRISQAAA